MGVDLVRRRDDSVRRARRRDRTKGWVVVMDAARPARRAEFWRLVDIGESAACWEWRGGSASGYGYPRFSIDGRQQYAHRLAYEFRNGPIPNGYEVDHLCRNKLCMNPRHLEAVPPLVNLARNESPASVNGRKTHCIHGHEFTPENTTLRKDGSRQCRTCRRKQNRAYRASRATR